MAPAQPGPFICEVTHCPETTDIAPQPNVRLSIATSDSLCRNAQIDRTQLSGVSPAFFDVVFDSLAFFKTAESGELHRRNVNEYIRPPSAMMCSRDVNTTLPSATMPSLRIASRITANACWPTSPSGTMK